MTATDLSDDMRRRLEAFRGRGCEVDGPTVAEDTSPTGPASSDEHRDRAWHVVLRCAGPGGDTICAEGNGLSPDDAARAAIAELQRSAPAVAGGGGSTPAA